MHTKPILFKNQLPYSVVIYDSFSGKNEANFFGTLTKLTTLRANSSGLVKPIHEFASVFIACHEITGGPLARFEWLWVDPPRDFVVTEADRMGMAEAMTFISFMKKHPDNHVSKHFKHIMAETTPENLLDRMNAFFASQLHYQRVTFSTYMMAVAFCARSGNRAADQGSCYSLARLVELMGGEWPAELPDIEVTDLKIEKRQGSYVFQGEIELKALPAEGKRAIRNFAHILDASKLTVTLMFHYHLDLGVLGTRLVARMGDIALPLGGKDVLKLNQPTATININPLFRFISLELSANLPFSLFQTDLDAALNMTINNMEAHVGAIIKGEHEALPAPSLLKGFHFEEFGLGMGLFFEPPGYSLGVQGTFRIGSDGETVPLKDNKFAIVLLCDEEGVHPEYLSFYVPILDFAKVMELFTNAKTDCDLPISFKDLSFIWMSNPLNPVILPNGQFFRMALGFSAAVQIGSFDCFGQVSISLEHGLKAELTCSPLVLGDIFSLKGDGKGVRVKVDAEGNPIKNNVLTTSIGRHETVANARQKVLVSPGGPVFSMRTDHAPYLLVNGRVSLFELADVAINAEIDHHGMMFDLDFGCVLQEKMKCRLVSFHNFYGDLVFGIDDHIKLPLLDDVGLGTIHLVATIHAKLKILTSEKQVEISVAGGFDFEGLRFSIPTLMVDIDIAGLSELISFIGHQLTKLAEEIFEPIIKDVEHWASWVGKKIIEGVDDMAKALKTVFKQSLHDAALIMKKIGRDIVIITKDLKAAYKVTAAVVAAGLKEAGYAIHEIAHGLKEAEHITAEEVSGILKNIGYAAQDVAACVHDVFDLTSDALTIALKTAAFVPDEIASALKNIFNLDSTHVAKALKLAGFPAGPIAGALASVFNLGGKAIHDILGGIGFLGSELLDFIDPLSW